MMKKYILAISMMLSSVGMMAQTPRTGYFIEGSNFSHELNPALQPDSDYLSLPLLGNTSVSLGTSMKMEDLLFDAPNGRLTTFLSKNTISKGELMDRVGDGLLTSFDMRMKLVSLGMRVNANRYRTIGVTWRTQLDANMPKDLFRCLKDVENGSYDLSDMSVNAMSFFEVAYGESHRINEKWTVGGKAKLLLGVANLNVDVDNLNVNLAADDSWTAQGKITVNASGLEYEMEEKEYKSKPGTYSQVNDAKVGGLGLNGWGLALDAGATYKINEEITLSAALLDLGFINWTKSNKAENSGEKFEFEGFKDVCSDKESDNSLQHQADRLGDELMDMAHLEDKGQCSFSKMLGATVELGGQYKRDFWNAGLLLSTRLQGKTTWREARLNLGADVLSIAKKGGKKHLDIVLSPTYNSFGTSLGGMLSYRNGGFQAYLASDRLVFEVNKQMIPTSLCGAVQFGLTFAL